MRIIAGKLKGYVLHDSNDKNTRPLKDMVRESIFNLLNHSNKFFFDFKNSNILDLYAGTGSFGLECLSRGARHVYFVENRKSALEILKKNIDKLKVKKKSEIFFIDTLKLKNKKNIFNFKFNLIFFDPPYKDFSFHKIIEFVSEEKLLTENGLIVLHRSKSTKEKLPNHLNILDERIYGQSKIIFGKF